MKKEPKRLLYNQDVHYEYSSHGWMFFQVQENTCKVWTAHNHYRICLLHPIWSLNRKVMFEWWNYRSRMIQFDTQTTCTYIYTYTWHVEYYSIIGFIWTTDHDDYLFAFTLHTAHSHTSHVTRHTWITRESHVNHTSHAVTSRCLGICTLSKAGCR